MPIPRKLPGLASRRLVAVVASIAGALTLTACPSAARADLDFQLGATGGLSWIRTMPALDMPATTTFARDVPGREVAIGGPLYALGAGFDVALIADDRWIVPLLGATAYAAVGTYDTRVTSVDGSIARIRPWTTYEVDVLLPGIGYRVKKRRFMFSASLRSGIVALSTNGSVAAASESVPVSLTGFSPLLQVELEACRRLDPVVRVCAQVAPRIYNFGLGNGATFGLRVEWGR